MGEGGVRKGKGQRGERETAREGEGWSQGASEGEGGVVREGRGGAERV